MTDYALSAPDQAAMYAAFDKVGIRDADGNIRTQGLFPDGTDWCLLDFGQRWYPSGKLIPGPMGDQPEMITDGLYWVSLRWNGDAPTPPLPADITIAWASNDENAGGYPAGLPRFA
jgi:hypothetical protein